MLGFDQKLIAENKETYLILEKTGNLVLYCENGDMIWESGTNNVNIEQGLIIQVTINQREFICYLTVKL